MSEYQYYEFRAVDRPLTSSEMAKLRAISSRAHITPTSFVNTYDYGDFRGDPEALMGEYFDAFVHLANWGTHWFMLRLPKASLGRREFRPYCGDECLHAWSKDEHTVLSFRADEVRVRDWEEDERWMDSLLSLRADLIGGDLRALYLGWLLCVQMEEIDVDVLEPPVPAGLRDLSPSLNSLAEFLDIDIDLIECAAEASADLVVATPSNDQLARWIAGLPAGEKDALLLRVAMGDPTAGGRLQQRFRSSLPEKPANPQGASRTAGQLWAAAVARSQEKAKREEQRRAEEAERKAQLKAAERKKYLDELEKREEATWRSVENLIALKRPQDYDRAVVLLTDLRELALRGGGVDSFQERLRCLMESHGKKPSFLEKVRKAKLNSL